MIKEGYVFPYDISDGIGYKAKWDDDILSMVFLKYYTDENSPNEIEVRFHGVTWIRSTNLIKYPCSDEEWDLYGYSTDKKIEDYLLLKREWFNDDYAEFMSGNLTGLCNIRAIEDNILFIDDRIIFSCTDIEIIRAIVNHNPGTER